MRNLGIAVVTLLVMFSCSSENQTQEENSKNNEVLTEETVEKTEDVKQGADEMVKEVEELGNEVDSLLNNI